MTSSHDNLSQDTRSSELAEQQARPVCQRSDHQSQGMGYRLVSRVSPLSKEACDSQVAAAKAGKSFVYELEGRLASVQSQRGGWFTYRSLPTQEAAKKKKPGQDKGFVLVRFSYFFDIRHPHLKAPGTTDACTYCRF